MLFFFFDVFSGQKTKGHKCLFSFHRITYEKNQKHHSSRGAGWLWCDGVAGAPGQDSLADLWLTDGAGGGRELSRRDPFMSASPHSAHFQSEVAKPLA